jgi:hypothetical protein
VLKPEMLVDVTFLAPKAPETAAGGKNAELKLYLPEQVIQHSEAGAYVWIADVSDKVARRAAVKTGSSATGGFVEVSGEGLTVASRVIARGFDKLDDGDRIRIVTVDVSPAPAQSPSTGQRPMDRLPRHGA